MSFEITTAMVEQYRSNVQLLSQQKVARLQETCEIVPVTGKVFYGERIGATTGQIRTTRHGDTPLISTPHSRRKGTVYDWEWADLIDKQDTPKVLIDISGKYVQNAIAAANRHKDYFVIAALGGAAYSGVAGATTVNNYDSGECRIINGDGTLATAGSDATNTTQTALTLAKLLTCKELLDAAEIDEDRPRYFVTNAYNLTQLLNVAEVKSSDYNTVKALAEGKIDTFLGFKFIRIEYRTDGLGLQYHGTDTDCVRCYAYAQGAITMGLQEDITTRITERDDKSYATQVYASQEMGATRNEGPAVVEILLKAAA